MTLLLQGLDGMKPLKAMGREESMRPLFEGDVRGLNIAQRTIVISREALAESYELIRALAVAGGLYVFVAVWGQPVDGLLVLALLFVRTLQKVSNVHDRYQIAATNQPAFAFLRSTIAAAEGAEERNLGSATPRLALRHLAPECELFLRSREYLGERLHDPTRWGLHRRRRLLGRRQDDRGRSDHRACCGPSTAKCGSTTCRSAISTPRHGAA